jgi:hypothetical protein
VHVTAPLDELLRREAARSQHRTLGLVAGHKALHDNIRADLVIDTSAVTPEEAAARILGCRAAEAGQGALHRYLAPSGSPQLHQEQPP